MFPTRDSIKFTVDKHALIKTVVKTDGVIFAVNKLAQPSSIKKFSFHNPVKS
jgi:hypothetical protein